MSGTPKYIGVVNVTPDSFSDGGDRLAPHAASEALEKHLSDGADMVDIGADSTRPGSLCIGPEEEWQRLSLIIPEAVKFGAISVDTHHLETAQRALDLGVHCINDVSGGSAKLFELAKKYNAKVIAMYSQSRIPHTFLKQRPENLIESIELFFQDTIRQASEVGFNREDLLLDPGMGGFISNESADSFFLLRSLPQLEKFSPLVLGVSRKGFLRLISSIEPQKRDLLSAVITAISIRGFGALESMYIRAHAVPVNREIISASQGKSLLF